MGSEPLHMTDKNILTVQLQQKQSMFYGKCRMKIRHSDISILFPALYYYKKLTVNKDVKSWEGQEIKLKIFSCFMRYLSVEPWVSLKIQTDYKSDFD